MVKKQSVLNTRRALLAARTAAAQTTAALDAAIEVVETDTVDALVKLTAAMRAIANAPEGASASNLRALAQSVLDRTKIGRKA
jgi:hypothetical protein